MELVTPVAIVSESFVLNWDYVFLQQHAILEHVCRRAFDLGCYVRQPSNSKSNSEAGNLWNLRHDVHSLQEIIPTIPHSLSLCRTSKYTPVVTCFVNGAGDLKMLTSLKINGNTTPHRNAPRRQTSTQDNPFVKEK